MKTPKFSRYFLASAAPLFLFAAIAVRPVRAADDVSNLDPSALSGVALHWLADWDARNWEACWSAFSPDIKGNIRLDRWSLAEGYYKDRLGNVGSRKLVGLESTFITGEIVIVKFEATFEHKGLRSEGVYLEKQRNGSWGVYALVNKPISAPWPREWGNDDAASAPLEIHWSPAFHQTQDRQFGAQIGPGQVPFGESEFARFENATR